MKFPSINVALLSGVAACFAFPSFANAQTNESRWGKETEIKSSSVVLTRRSDNGAYGTSAFSFRKDSQDVGEHRNYVDLVYNGCGLLHFNPCAGMDSRVADLGENDLGVKVEDDKERFWAEKAFPPEEGHVYLHKVKCHNQTMTVKFRVNELSHDEIKIDWTIVKELSGPERAGGMAGTMGQCGGAHAGR